MVIKFYMHDFLFYFFWISLLISVFFKVSSIKKQIASKAKTFTKFNAIYCKKDENVSIVRSTLKGETVQLSLNQFSSHFLFIADVAHVSMVDCVCNIPSRYVFTHFPVAIVSRFCKQPAFSFRYLGRYSNNNVWVIQSYVISLLLHLILRTDFSVTNLLNNLLHNISTSQHKKCTVLSTQL